MILFETTLTLVLAAIVLLQVARRLAIPYPTMLALAGVLVAALPWAPEVTIDPHLALALFIAPALLDAAYDLPPRAIRRYWPSLLALAAVAVLLTTGAVAWAAAAWAGLPLAAAIALGAIVAPPDAAAAAAMLGRFPLPRRTVTVLKGESLLNDAVALLIFTAAVGSAAASASLPGLVTRVALAVPGGVLLGLLIGLAYMRLSPRVAGTLGGTLFEFASTFGTWVAAERLHVSAILAVVVFAMTVAREMPARQSPRDRVHSYAVWDAAVFLLNVLAFLLMGLQVRVIVSRLPPAQTRSALAFALLVLAIVIVVRVVWVLLYNRIVHRLSVRRGSGPAPSLAQGAVVAWCGMRGLVTLAAALALPAAFPGRDLIVLSALMVVLGTLIVQGLTLGPLIRWLRFAPDESFEKALSFARVTMLDAAMASLGDRTDAPAVRVRAEYEEQRSAAADGRDPRAVTASDDLHRQAIAAQRRTLAALRRAGRIDDDVFHALEQTLDWDELATSPPERFELVEG